MKKIVLVLLLVIIFSVVALAAQEEVKTIHVRAGYLKNLGDKIEVSNEVIMRKESNEITAPRGIYYKKEKRAELRDGVILKHSQGEISSKEMTAFFNDDKYIFKDEVELIQELKENDEFTLQAAYLELFLKDNSFKGENGIVINYHDRVLKGEEVIYNDQRKTLQLKNNVYIEEENGDWIKSQEAIFYLETEEFTAGGEIELEFSLREE